MVVYNGLNRHFGYMKPDFYYEIALSSLSQIGARTIHTLFEHFDSAEEILKANAKAFENIPKITHRTIELLKQKPNEKAIYAEIDFIEKHQIEVLTYTHQQYPERLRNCVDAPFIVYYKGTANLAKKKVIGIVGSRMATDYGKNFIKNLMQDLAPFDPLIISGLAYGIDITAHQEALNNNLETIGILAHGLDMIYPKAHVSIAKEMHLQGGLLTEYRFGQMPEKGNFPARNRIIAGLCDAIIVVEARQKGGALITAELANSYNREVFALPGRIYDTQSLGCNDLIKSNAAQLIQSAEDVIIGLAWDAPQSKRQIQTKLLAQLTPFEQEIISQLQIEPLQIDNLMLALGCTAAALSIGLTSLEIKGVITYLPGKFIMSYY